jgi:hypothetical protein
MREGGGCVEGREGVTPSTSIVNTRLKKTLGSDSVDSSPTNSDADFVSSDEFLAAPPKGSTIDGSDGDGQDTQEQYTFGTPGRRGLHLDWECTLMSTINEAFNNRELKIKKGTYKWSFLSTSSEPLLWFT